MAAVALEEGNKIKDAFRQGSYIQDKLRSATAQENINSTFTWADSGFLPGGGGGVLWLVGRLYSVNMVEGF